MKKIELIEIKLDGSVAILPHPKQAELYGEEILDEDFLESIRLQGILQPPVVTYLSDIHDGFENADGLDPYTIVVISGHRRWRASEMLGEESLTFQLKRYNNYFDSEVDHITYNKQRKKSKRQIANEINVYKQKLSHVRKILENEGIEALERFKSFDFLKHVQVDENGKHFLPFGTDLITKDLGISKKHQEQLNVIFNEDWEQDKIEVISISSLSEKQKKKATSQFSKLLEEARLEVDKKDGLSINKVHTEIMRVWNDIDSIINPKPKEKKTKKKDVSKVWTKPKDIIYEKIDAEYYDELISSGAEEHFTSKAVDGVIDGEAGTDIVVYGDNYFVYCRDEKKGFRFDTGILYNFLKEQT